MSHVKAERIHATIGRALDVRVRVATDEDPGDFSEITFRVGSDVIEKTGLAAVASPTGFWVDFTLTAADLAVESAKYTWELTAVFGGEVRTLALGDFYVGRTPTVDTP